MGRLCQPIVPGTFLLRQKYGRAACRSSLQRAEAITHRGLFLLLVGATALGGLADDSTCPTADAGMFASRSEIAEPTLCILLATGSSDDHLVDCGALFSRCRSLDLSDGVSPADPLVFVSCNA